jgi:glycosyltransferase involved in cell wall biosynthesis
MDAQEDGLNDRPLRVGIVLGSLEAGGAQRMALELARGLLEAGDAVRLFTLDRDRAMALAGTPEAEAALEARLELLGTGSVARGTLAKALALPVLHRRLERRIAAERLDVVVSFMERANLLNLMGRQAVPRVISIRKHIGRALADKPPLKRWLVRRAYPFVLSRAAAVTFNACASAADFTQRFPVASERVHVIPNSVDPRISDLARQPPEDFDAEFFRGPTLVTAGRLVPAKGQVPLLRAFASVAAQLPEARLVVLGDGPLRAALEDAARRLGLGERIRFLGFRANPYPWIARASLFALASRAEGFPNALLEAMRLGVPALAADCPSGPRELLAPETPVERVADRLEAAPYGLLVPPMPDTDPAVAAPLGVGERALAEGMLALLRSPDHRAHYAARAAERADAFAPAAVIRQWRGLLSAVTADAVQRSTTRMQRPSW